MTKVLSRFKIGTRIAVAILVPVLAMLVFTAMQVMDALSESSRMARLHKLTDLAPSVSEVVHELQKERGMSAGFISSGGASFADSLPGQRDATDQRIANLEGALAAFEFDGYDAEFARRIDVAMARLTELDNMRGAVSDTAATVPEMAGYYTGTISDLLDIVESMKALASDVTVLNEIAAYTAYLQAKERAGQERAMGAAGFAAGEFNPALYRNFVSLIAMQETFQDVFVTHALPAEVEHMEHAMSDPVVGEVEAMRQAALESVEVGHTGGVEAVAWLAAMTGKIDLMKEVEDHVAGDLSHEATVLEDAANEMVVFKLGLSAVLLVVTAFLCVVIVRSITRPLGRVTAAVTELADGNTDIGIEQPTGRDEVADIERAVVVFRDNMIEMDRLRAEQAEAEKRTEAERRRAVTELADSFESSVKGVVDAVAAAFTEVKAMAESVAGNAEDTKNRSGSVATAAQQMSGNVQTVASATEELNASVTEIGSQVTRASEIAAEGARKAEQTDAEVTSLVDAAQEIGEVVRLIGEIAEQTNLLALNATIEAARAGEAGKGFAVVASEVKSLANQTARATNDISQQVASIQSATGNAAEAIRAIGQTVGEVSEIASAIAAAMNEQGSATQEIARSVQDAAQGTQEVTDNIGQVSMSAEDAGQAAGTMVEAATDLSQQAETLAYEVDAFVAKVRAG